MLRLLVWGKVISAFFRGPVLGDLVFLEMIENLISALDFTMN